VVSGGLSLQVAQLLLRAATPERMALAVRDQELLVDELVKVSTYASVAAIVAYWVQRVDDEVGTPPPTEPVSSMYWSRSEIGGESHMHGTFSPVDTEIIEAELKRRMEQARRRDRAEGRRRRGLAELRAQALVDMAARSINAHGASARPLLQIIVGDDTAGHLCQLAHLRTFTGALRTAIQVRDRRCQHSSGCSKPAVDCDVDHIIPWAAGGVTSQFNGHSKCSTQNRNEDLGDDPTPQPERTITRQDETDAIATWRTRHRRNTTNTDDDCDDDESEN
jgi:hypothetical protein